MRLVLALGMALLAAVLCAMPLVKSVENRLYDMRVRWVAQSQRVSDDIVVVAIDDNSLQQMADAVGSWPWPRGVHALILEYCSSASVIAADILMPERQWQYRDTDEAYLVQAVRKLGDKVVLAAEFQESTADTVAPEGLASMRVQCPPDCREHIRSFSHVLAPYDDLLAACGAVGAVSAVRDADGVRALLPGPGRIGRACVSVACPRGGGGASPCAVT